MIKSNLGASSRKQTRVIPEIVQEEISPLETIKEQDPVVHKSSNKGILRFWYLSIIAGLATTAAFGYLWFSNQALKKQLREQSLHPPNQQFPSPQPLETQKQSIPDFVQSDSDDIESIDQDLNDTALEGIDQELQDIEEELNLL
ncbi:hypothetical protein ACFLZP_00690 [Patescibacteria group bacterium]